MVHICSRHSGNMAGAKTERSEVEAEPQRSEVERRHLPCADYSSSRGFLSRSGLGRGFSRGAASPAEQIRAGCGYGLGVWGALAPRGTVRVFAGFEPGTGMD